ncbi:MAG: hypothetical protein LBS41_06235 [Streptococcaceae bacterium]|nr:hypothetical protein [Streptococcaceae bacterium]
MNKSKISSLSAIALTVFGLATPTLVAAVKFAIDKGMNSTSVGIDIPFVAKTITVTTP